VRAVSLFSKKKKRKKKRKKRKKGEKKEGKKKKDIEISGTRLFFNVRDVRGEFLPT
jgi:hypothetical protein